MPWFHFKSPTLTRMYKVPEPRRHKCDMTQTPPRGEGDIRYQSSRANMDILPVFLKVYRPKVHFGSRRVDQKPIRTFGLYTFTNTGRIDILAQELCVSIVQLRRFILKKGAILYTIYLYSIFKFTIMVLNKYQKQ